MADRKQPSSQQTDSGVHDPRLSGDDRVTDGPGHRAMSPASPSPRPKQRGGRGQGDAGEQPPEPRPKRRGGVAGEQA